MSNAIVDLPPFPAPLLMLVISSSGSSRIPPRASWLPALQVCGPSANSDAHTMPGYATLGGGDRHAQAVDADGLSVSDNPDPEEPTLVIEQFKPMLLRQPVGIHKGVSSRGASTHAA